MKIALGSKNPVKIEALREIIKDYPCLKNAEIFFNGVSSQVSEQPKSLEETVKGAINRAKEVFKDCDFSFGIESGLMAVPGTKTGFMDVCVCSICDGKEFYLGLSSAWETPKLVADYMLKDGLDMNQAAFKAGLTKNEKVGSAEGLIGIMTKGRLPRKEYTKEAIRTALIHLENK
jgi:inosine/xanthosine triphosphatase